MILVTGGSGFLGAHVLVQLSALSDQLIAAKRVTTSLNYVKKVFQLAGASDRFEKINVDEY